MKKATVIIIAAIYVASIIIVGVFGMKALIYTEMVYVQDIVFADKINGKDVKPATDGSGGYTLGLKYENGLEVSIEFTPIPANATMRNDIEVEITSQSGSDEEPCATYDSGTVFFHKRGQITLRVSSKDGGKVVKELRISAL